MILTKSTLDPKFYYALAFDKGFIKYDNNRTFDEGNSQQAHLEAIRVFEVNLYLISFDQSMLVTICNTTWFESNKHKDCVVLLDF